MRHSRHIHNLDTLDKEIDRLKIVVGDSEKQLANDFSYLKDNFCSLTKNSIRKERHRDNSSFFDHIFKTDRVRSAVSAFTDRISDQVESRIENLIARIFKKS